MMFNKGATNATMAAPAVANQMAANASPMSDPWQNMRQVTAPVDQTQQNQLFKGMMEKQEPQAQFSPVQFGGSGNQQVLAQYIASLLGKG